MTKGPEVIVIGLDGATWDLIKPWADEDKLPTFKKLMDEGAWGKLTSTLPPVTFPAWECIFTGVNPGKLGVYAFVSINTENKSFRVNVPSSFMGKPVWKILNEYGLSTCMIGIPTSKVQAVDGVMVGGVFSVNNVAYPKKIKGTLKRMNYETYPYELTKMFIESSNSAPSFELIKNTISSRFRLAKDLADEGQPDFLALIVFLIDNIQHNFWGEPLVYKTWKHIDKELGDFISLFNNSTTILVSDHGFTKLDKTFYISKFLEERGLLTYKDNSQSRVKKAITQDRLVRLARIFRIDGALQKMIKKDTLLSLLSRFPTKEGRFGAKALEKVVDWEKSKCVPLSCLIYLNCLKEEKGGIKKFVRDELKKLDIIDDVLFKDEVYSGKYLDLAPDIIIKPKKGVRVLETPFKDTIVSTERSERWTGDHAQEGIFLIHGPKVKNMGDSSINATVADIAPTILSLFGIPSIPDMDGRVLNEVIGEIAIKQEQQMEKLRIRHRIKRLGDRLC